MSDRCGQSGDGRGREAGGSIRKSQQLDPVNCFGIQRVGVQ
jgi:hypothetical protein